MFAIIIDPSTRELIAAMNEGVVPVVENEDSYFVYHDHDTPAEIITSEEMRERLDNHFDWHPLDFRIWRR